MRRISEELLAQRLRDIRGVRTYKEMEALTGIDFRLMKRMEQKKYFPSRKHLRLLFETFGICEADVTVEEQGVYTAFRARATNEAERAAFERILLMMECVRKYDGLEGEDYG